MRNESDLLILELLGKPSPYFEYTKSSLLGEVQRAVESLPCIERCVVTARINSEGKLTIQIRITPNSHNTTEDIVPAAALVLRDFADDSRLFDGGASVLGI